MTALHIEQRPFPGHVPLAPPDTRKTAAGALAQVMRSAHRYEAVGSGYLLSLGSFATTEDLDWEPVRRVGMALSVAERHTGGVKSPFHVHMQERKR